VPRTDDPQRSSARRRLALGVAALVLVPTGLLTACGNAAVKQRDDNRPEPNASTEGVRSVYPTPPTTTEAPVEPLKTGPPSPQPPTGP
jgi:hypothetical protein